MRTATFVAVTALAVVLVGALAALVTWLLQPSSPSCGRGCPPPTRRATQAPAFAAERTYVSPFGFAFDYPRNWNRRQATVEGMPGVFLAGNDAAVFVLASRGVPAAGALTLPPIDFWNPQLIPDVERVGFLRGSHVGDADGQGVLYKGSLVPQSGGGAQPIRLANVAARKGNVTVLVAGVVPLNEYNKAWGGAAGTIDYLLAEFRWGGSSCPAHTGCERLRR
jgi:hypothetical protein